jgi:hypothetical protein
LDYLHIVADTVLYHYLTYIHTSWPTNLYAGRLSYSAVFAEIPVCTSKVASSRFENDRPPSLAQRYMGSMIEAREAEKQRASRRAFRLPHPHIIHYLNKNNIFYERFQNCTTL